jgi:hypothetical protein
VVLQLGDWVRANNPPTIKFIALMMEAACTSETSVDNYFTWQYTPEGKSELILAAMRT